MARRNISDLDNPPRDWVNLLCEHEEKLIYVGTQ